ncbi:hypothetical protein MVES_002457 [Malassezia vespertilionis]|uniref:Deacetylase sirtuin-type domain-containing protein n=1 Tax=Malassezia vespertilionis TaxID=2020962 RepID=A0A2N1JAT8_9BASI|nr:hypothetical protein MVES_002457 [Malassezia vespertilionis]
MRVSIPALPNTQAHTPNVTELAAAVDRVTALLRNSKKPVVITGAGVSVDSGIKSYRGENGMYLNPGYRPIFYHEFANTTAFGDAKRRRYWARSFLGYPPLRMAAPNSTHDAIARLMQQGIVHRLITQNVDRLHHAAWTYAPAAPIVELHGSLSEVRCIGRGDGEFKHNDEAWWDVHSTRAFGPIDRFYTRHLHTPDAQSGCGFVAARDALQDYFAVQNPDWEMWAKRLEKEPGLHLRRNPDGDVQLDGVEYNNFYYPACPSCGGILKPDVVFFGENIRASVKRDAEACIASSDALLILGTTLATHSAFPCGAGESRPNTRG